MSGMVVAPTVTSPHAHRMGGQSLGTEREARTRLGVLPEEAEAWLGLQAGLLRALPAEAPRGDAALPAALRPGGGEVGVLEAVTHDLGSHLLPALPQVACSERALILSENAPDLALP